MHACAHAQRTTSSILSLPPSRPRTGRPTRSTRTLRRSSSRGARTLGSSWRWGTASKATCACTCTCVQLVHAHAHACNLHAHAHAQTHPCTPLCWCIPRTRPALHSGVLGRRAGRARLAGLAVDARAPNGTPVKATTAHTWAVMVGVPILRARPECDGLPQHELVLQYMQTICYAAGLHPLPSASALRARGRAVLYSIA